MTSGESWNPGRIACDERKKSIRGSMRHLISQLMCLAAISSISVFWNHPLTALRHNYHPSHARGWKKRIIVWQFASVSSANNLIMVAAYGSVAPWRAFLKRRKSNTPLECASFRRPFFSGSSQRGWTSSRISLIILCPLFSSARKIRSSTASTLFPVLPAADAAYASQYSSTIPPHQSQALANYPNQLEPARGMSFN